MFLKQNEPEEGDQGYAQSRVYRHGSILYRKTRPVQVGMASGDGRTRQANLVTCGSATAPISEAWLICRSAS